MTVCRSAIAARAMLRTPGTIARAARTYRRISGCGLVRVRMRTCTSVGVSSCHSLVRYASLWMRKSIMRITASLCRCGGYAVGAAFHQRFT